MILWTRRTQDYTAGRMTTGELKQLLIGVLTQLVAQHQAARVCVTDDMVDTFMSVRAMHV